MNTPLAYTGVTLFLAAHFCHDRFALTPTATPSVAVAFSRTPAPAIALPHLSERHRDQLEGVIAIDQVDALENDLVAAADAAQPKLDPSLSIALPCRRRWDLSYHPARHPCSARHFLAQ
jgi:hypothetical protein